MVRSVTVCRRIGVLAALVALAGTSCAAPATDRPHDGAVIAILRAVPGVSSTVPAFLDELRSAGFTVGGDLVVLGADPDEAYPDDESARQAVREWRAGGVDLIVAFSTAGARIATETAPDVDVLFLSNDPVAAGLVGNADRPEARATGVTFRVPADRTLDLARRAVPGLDLVGIATAGDAAADAHAAAIFEAADALGVGVVVEEFDEEIGPAVSRLAERGVDALLLSNSPGATSALAETEDAAAKAGLPLISNSPLAESAVVSLAPDVAEIGRQLARQAARLLSGSGVVAVPVEDPRRFVTTVNPSAAAGFGIELPDELLREADRVAEG